MKKRILFGVFAMLLANVSNAQLNNLYRKNSSLISYDRHRVYEAPSGNVVLARMDDSYGIGDGNDLIQMYSPDGTMLWSFGEEDIFDGANSNYIDIAFDSESNVYICGSNFPMTAFYPKSEVIKLSPSGQELWRINFTQQSDWSEEVFEIEITEDNRIFLLAQLYQDSLQSIGPVFIEIDNEGNTLQFQPDPSFTIGYSQLFAPNDGFLYVVNESHVAKLGYDGSVVWNSDFGFADGIEVYFSYESFEYNVVFSNNKIYVSSDLYDPMLAQPQFGMTIFNLDGDIEQTLAYSILPDVTSLLDITPLHLKVDALGNIYVAGTFSYGDPQGPTMQMDDADMTDANRGGKGGSLMGSFATRIDQTFNQNWSVGHFQEVVTFTYPTGIFITNERLAVVYNEGSFDLGTQLIECYDNATGNVVWSHSETANGVFEQSTPTGSLLDSDGALYTFGRGINTIETGTENSIYLYKYELLANGMEEMSNNDAHFIWPNPARQQLFVNTKVGTNCISVYDASGKLVLKQLVNSQIKVLDVSSFSPGVFTLVQTGDSSVVSRFVVE
jgi:hypothetical protein